MPYELPAALSRAMDNLAIFSSASSNNLTELPRARLGELFESIFSTIKESPENTKFLTMIHKLHRKYLDHYTSQTFPGRFAQDGNKDFGELIGHVLYYIRLHLRCIDLFDRDNKHSKLAQNLMNIIEHQVAPLVCNDRFYHDDFIAAYKNCHPHTLSAPSNYNNFAEEAIYYSEFAFSCSGYDPKNKVKLFNQTSHAEQEKKNAELKKKKKPPTPRKSFNGVFPDFINYLRDCKIKLDEARIKKASVEDEKKSLANQDILFDNFIIRSHEPVLMDLQSFLWNEFDMPIGSGLSKYLENYSNGELANLFKPTFSYSTPKVVRENITRTFLDFQNKIMAHKNNLPKLISIMQSAKNDDAQYGKYFDFQTEIENMILHIMNFWFFYEKKYDTNQLFAIFENLPKDSAVYQHFGLFLQKIALRLDPKYSHASSKHLLLAEHLITAEEETGKINPKLTGLLRALAFEQNKEGRTLIISTPNHDPRRLAERRNSLLEKLSKQEQKEHTIYNFTWLKDELKNRVKNCSLLVRLDSANYKRFLDAVNKAGIESGDEKVLSQLMFDLKMACKDALFPGSNRKLIEELQELILRTIVDTCMHQKIFYDKEKNLDKHKTLVFNDLLSSIIAKSVYDGPQQLAIIDKLYNELNYKRLGEAALCKLLKAILKSPLAQKKYIDRLPTIRNLVGKTTIFSKAQLCKIDDKLEALYDSHSSTAPELTLWQSIVASCKVLITRKQPKRKVTPEVVFIEDNKLTQFCNADPKEHFQVFFNPALNLDPALLKLSQPTKVLYSSLRAKLTAHLSIHQFIHDVEHSQNKRYADDTTIQIDKTRSICPQSRSLAWKACIRSIRHSQIKHFESKLGVTSDIYIQASILSAALAKDVAIYIKPFLDNPKFTEELQDRFIEKICTIFTSLKHIAPPQRDDDFLVLWAQEVSSIAIRSVCHEDPELSTMITALEPEVTEKPAQPQPAPQPETQPPAEGFSSTRSSNRRRASVVSFFPPAEDKPAANITPPAAKEDSTEGLRRSQTPSPDPEAALQTLAPAVITQIQSPRLGRLG